MKDGYIAVIDSGIGGLSVLKELVKSLPNEKFIYYGDNYNAPYGNRTKADLLDLSVDIVIELLHYHIKAIVLACNTLSATVLSDLEYYFPNVAFYGVFPPVEILTLRKRKTLLLCTPNTSKLYKNNEYLTVAPLKNLAEDIEKNVFNLEKVDLNKHFKTSVLVKNDILTTFDENLTTVNQINTAQWQKRRFEAVILGCTHYFFIKKQIFNHFQPQILVRGEIFTVKKLKRKLEFYKIPVNYKQNRLLFLGKCSFYNEKIFKILFYNSK